MKRLFYRLVRRIVRMIARPSLTGLENLPEDAEVVFVLQKKATTDLIMLDLVTAEAGVISPLAPLATNNLSESSRFFALLRAASGRMTMRDMSGRLTRLLSSEQDPSAKPLVLVPTSVFWGRAMTGETSWFKILTSEHWAVTGRIKRTLNLFINRHNIIVHIGRPIAAEEVADPDPEIAVRRCARLLRVRLRQQKERTLGPDLSHRRTLIDQILTSRAVSSAIEETLATTGQTDTQPRFWQRHPRRRLEKQAFKYANTIASDMSHPTIRILSGLLTWFWTRIYDGIELKGIDRITQLGETHTLVYVPSHRSHLDYLLLSYLLYYRGFMIPHIVAGDNLNLPVLGGILRRGGAIFMRRTFKDAPIYTAVFEEYLYQVYRRGHSVEFFPEGGRSRTGRLLPAKFGILKMTVGAHDRGLPKPLAFVPVYFGYEKLVEGASYLSELRGADKKKESSLDVVRNLKLIKQDFGEVVVNIGEPLTLPEWQAKHSHLNEEQQLAVLSQDIMRGINQAAHINAINLTALVTLATPRLAIEEALLSKQIELFQNLCEVSHAACTWTTQAPAEIIAYAENLQLVDREDTEFGTVLSHDPHTAVLMTWYRNNVMHAFALPSLIACLLIRRRRSVSRERLYDMTAMIYPNLARELSINESIDEFDAYLARLADRGLLRIEDGNISVPQTADTHYEQLLLLANLVMQTLERMFIVLHQLSLGPQNRDELRSSSHLVAQKISRIYGINAPEFSDQRLFDLFIDGLVADGAACQSDEGDLTATPVIQNVVRAAEYVIEPQIRFGVMSASPHDTTADG